VLLVPNLRPNRDSTDASKPAPRPSLRLLLDPPFRKLAIAAGVLGLLTISDGFLYLSLQDRDDLAAQWFPLLFVGTNVVYLALAVPLGRLADKIGRIRVFVGGYGLLLIAYLCAAVPSGGAIATLFCLALLGSFYAATDGVLSAAAAALVPAGLRGSAIGTVQTVVAATRLVSSLAFGWLWFDLGRDTALYAVAGALAVALPLTWWMVRGVHSLKAPLQ
jgi:MFS family permease